MKKKRKSRSKWAICLGCFYEPCTWGKVVRMDDGCVEVKYGKDADWWPSELWERKHVKIVSTEKEAREAVDAHEKTIVYDPR